MIHTFALQKKEDRSGWGTAILKLTSLKTKPKLKPISERQAKACIFC